MHFLQTMYHVNLVYIFDKLLKKQVNTERLKENRPSMDGLNGSKQHMRLFDNYSPCQLVAEKTTNLIF